MNYRYTISGNTVFNVYLSERNLYGSSRLGQEQLHMELTQAAPFNYGGLLDNAYGDKRYELSNHLGNVLQVITDRKLPENDGTNHVAHYLADVVSYSDYFPYGMQMSGRNGNDGDGYRFGFQSQEVDNEVKGVGDSVSYKYRMHDPRIGRFFAVDPLAKRYPFYSPYAFSGNRVLDAIELEGLEPGILFKTVDQAAVNFGLYYNDNSIRENVEYASRIYKTVDAKGIEMYAYTEGVAGSVHKSEIPKPVPEGTEMVAQAHTHSAYQRETDNEFSGVYVGDGTFGGDLLVYRQAKKDGYVTTPNGQTLKFDYSEYTIQQIAHNAPSDPNDPSRLNNISPEYENFIKLGHIEFNSNLARKKDNYLIVRDIKTKKDYGVIRNGNGSYDFYNGSKAKAAEKKKESSSKKINENE